MAKSVKPVQAVRRTMVKKVNVYAPIPIRTVTPTIYGKLEGVSMSPATILKCLIGRATVHEILSDGSLLKLTDKNYNTENRPAVNKVAKQGKIDKPKSAIAPNDTRVKKILLDDAIKLNGLGTIKTDEKVSEVQLNEAKPETIEIENKPNLVEDKEAPMIMAQYSEDTSTETEKEEPKDEDSELAELEAEIAKLEAEEAANKKPE